MEKQQMVIIALSVGLFITFQYFIINEWIEEKNKETEQSLDNAYEQGRLDMGISMVQQTNDCNAVTITLNNVTRVLFDLNCIENIPEPDN